METTIRVNAIQLADGRVLKMPARGRNIPEVGTAVAVTPDGWLVTAAHVAAPSRRRSRGSRTRPARLPRRPHADEQAAREWVDAERRGAVPGTRHLDGGHARERGRRPQDEKCTGDGPAASPTADLALVRIPVRGAPALALDDAGARARPIATIGFSGDDRLMTGGRGARRGDGPARRDPDHRDARAGEPGARTGLVVSAGVRAATPAARWWTRTAPSAAS